MLDLPTTTEQGKAAVAMEAWQIKFRKPTHKPPTGVIQMITEPRRLIAQLQPTDAAEVLAELTALPDNVFTIVWMPAGTKTSVSVERNAEAWVSGGQATGNKAPVRAGVRTVRVFWTLNRALIYANPENISSALDAVIRFTVTHLETIALEAEVGSTWAAIEADAPLTHSVTARQQRQQSHVDAMTLTATQMKVKFLRITQALEQLDSSLEDISKRIYAELVLAAALHDRLELLEDPVQFALEHYEVANTRLSEAKFARKEQRQALIGHVLEAAIVLLLLYPLHLFW